MSKTVLLWDDARKKLFEGMKIVSTAVMSSMGPCGRNAVLWRFDRSPVVTNDGVTIAREISLQDPVENIWASIIKEAAEKTNKEVGDWTTTTTCLTYAIAKHGLSELETWTNPFTLSKELHEVGNQIVKKLAGMTKIVKHTDSKVKDIASISAQDEEIGEVIARCIKEIWPDGQISVEISKEIGIKEELKKWYVVDAGLVSPIFMLDEELMQSDLSDVIVFSTDQDINDFWGVLVEVLQDMQNNNMKNIIIMANDVSWNALDAIIKNNKSWNFNIIVTGLPSIGQNTKDILKDISIVCWSTDMENCSIGRADRVVSWKDSTLIIWWHWDEKSVEKHIAILRKREHTEKNEYHKEKVSERISRLSSGVGIIYVGCQTEMEAVNKKYKIEDAICATKSAIKNWIVVGGGMSLIKICKDIQEFDWGHTKEYYTAVWILATAIQYPAKTIISNAWFDWSKTIDKIYFEPVTYFDSKSWEFVSPEDYKIIDPAKVVECAIQNAISAACMFLTTDVIVFETEE